MRTLVLMRHAKTEPSHRHGDRERQLTSRGRADATAVGRELAGLGIDLVLCSTSVRTRQTVECLGLDARVEYHEVLYREGVATMVQRISEIEDDVQALLVVGHSPTIPWLSSRLAARSAPKEADQIGCWFPTAAWSQFSVEGSWADFAAPDLVETGLDEVEFVAVHRRD